APRFARCAGGEQRGAGVRGIPGERGRSGRGDQRLGVVVDVEPDGDGLAGADAGEGQAPVAGAAVERAVVGHAETQGRGVGRDRRRDVELEIGDVVGLPRAG
ncbi:MAG: hypothetical protein ACK559_21805, partial [bacterium]